MAKGSGKGALLFETFVALMVLSIGIVSVLRIFGESLFAGRMNRERLVVKQSLNRALFPWFAYPGGVKLGEGAALTLPVENGESEADYFLAMQTENLKPKEEEEDQKKGESQKQNTLPQSTQPVQLSEYYKIDCRVADENGEREILELKTVIYKLKQPGKK